jgi:hypothetical protein
MKAIPSVNVSLQASVSISVIRALDIFDIIS